MLNTPSNIKIGKSYLPSQLLEEMNKHPNLDIRFGHVLIKYGTEIKHEYFIDKNYIKNLNAITIIVYTIMTTPKYYNLAYKLLEDENIKEILECVKKDTTLFCIIDKNDLKKANYNYTDIKNVIRQINEVFKINKMPFKASVHDEEIKIKYSKRKEN